MLAFLRGDDEERAFWRRCWRTRSRARRPRARIELMQRHGSLRDTVERARHYGAIARDALGVFADGPEARAGRPDRFRDQPRVLSAIRSPSRNQLRRAASPPPRSSARPGTLAALAVMHRRLRAARAISRSISPSNSCNSPPRHSAARTGRRHRHGRGAPPPGADRRRLPSSRRRSRSPSRPPWPAAACLPGLRLRDDVRGVVGGDLRAVRSSGTIWRSCS